MKKYNIFSILMLVLCLSLVPIFAVHLASKELSVDFCERTINVDEIGEVSFEEKGQKFIDSLHNLKIEASSSGFSYSGELSTLGVQALSDAGADYDTEISADFRLSEDKVVLSKIVKNAGEESLEAIYSVDENDTIWLTSTNGDVINLTNEIEQTNIDECFAVTITSVTMLIMLFILGGVVIYGSNAPTYIYDGTSVISSGTSVISSLKDGVCSVWEKVRLACGAITAERTKEKIEIGATQIATVYTATKNRNDCYLLIDAVVKGVPLTTHYKTTSQKNASNWIKKGGSIWSPYSTTSASAVQNTGYIPGIQRKGAFLPFQYENHYGDDASSSVIYLNHYHCLYKQGGVYKKLGWVHAFFGLPVA